jgi:nitroreductase
MSRREATSGAPPPHGGADYQSLGRDPAAVDRRAAASHDATPEDPPRDMVVDMVAAASRAPSQHNTQPWRFRFEPATQTIDLYADPARALPVGDPGGRAVHIACGAALFNLRLAATVAGRQPVVGLIPDPGQPLLLATVRLAGPCQADQDGIELHAAIAARHTNRSPFSGRAVPPGVLAELAQAARIEGAVLHFPDRQETSRLLRLAQDAERDLLGDPAYRSELARWAGGQRDLEGVPDEVTGPREAGRATPVRDFTPARPHRAGYAWFEEEPQLAVLSTVCNARADWLRAGQALERTWLMATARGVAVDPHTQPLETADAWLVRDPRSGIEHPQMILRLGYGLPVPRAPRRPVSDVLDPPSAS